MFPVKYELGFYTAEDGILRSNCRGNVKSYTFTILTFIENSDVKLQNRGQIS
jgi:hypothetical protein